MAIERTQNAPSGALGRSYSRGMRMSSQNLGLVALVALGAAAILAACDAGGGGDKTAAAGGSGGKAGSGGTSGGGSGAAGGSPPVTCTNSADAGGFTFKRMAVWKDDAKSAYTMIHDDLCGSTLRGIDQLALPELDKRGLVAAVGPYVEACEDAGLWDLVKQAEQKGHEIINHSYTHAQIETTNSATEVVGAKTEFDKRLSNPVTFFIFPYDYWNAATLAAVGQAGHLGARAGNRDDNDGFDNPPINSPEPTNDLEIEFDVWPRTYSKYARYRAEEVLAIHAWQAIDKGGWGVREFHSVSADAKPPEDGSQGFGPVPLAVYQQHLDFLSAAWQENLIWTSTPSRIIRYRHARTACKASVAGSLLKFDTSNPDCTKYATPISSIVETANDLPSIQGLRAGKPVETRKIGPKTYSVTVNPTFGDVELSGCNSSGPSVGGGPTVAARPTPAASVCDIESIVGMGGSGKMDDLERAEADFQILPNPSQQDGRTGSWSWYPQNASVTLIKEATNTVLRYAGTNLLEWSGVTLAFLGGNGAGACYDASLYQGLRFKLKGSVVATDETNGQVIVSLVTAETQTQKYGGDLAGEGGHFNKLVPVTAAWQTVSIPWSGLSKPTWGPTMALPAVATKKLQAIDWGVSDKATSFELFLDDIELY